MTAANEERGEVSLSLEGIDYVMRPSFTAIQAIERKVGRSMKVLTMEAQRAEAAG
jgi:hypothetical protein